MNGAPILEICTECGGLVNEYGTAETCGCDEWDEDD